MANHAEEPLRKVTINLFESDVRALEFIFGTGWSKEVRWAVRRLVKERAERDKEMRGVR